MKKMTTKLAAAVLALWLLPMTALAQQLLVPGGQVIGLHLRGGTLTVAAMDDHRAAALREAGLQIGDELIAADGTPLSGVRALQQILERSDGAVTLTIRRGGTEKSIRVRPDITPEGPRLGVSLKEGISGIGTVTWYDPATGQVAALGHGISRPGEGPRDGCGQLYPAAVSSVRKGTSGAPGLLRGRLQSEQCCGSIRRNTVQGVFGSAAPGWLGEPLPVAAPGQIHPGKARIRSTISGIRPREYDVEILKVYPETRKTGRNLLLKVTDPGLLAATGGIVQGMSGSPIIQDGYLVGAVTHVLVNDPTRGYGIFIENMLEAAG